MTEGKDMPIQRRTKGFTLMEVIGVIAVIAILAAVATPQIFQAIQDARVSTLVQEANELRAIVARYYEDTGTWPRHIPTSNQDRFKQLMRNAANNNGATIPGWDGPYLDKELTNPITPGARVELLVTSNANYSCDLDADGNTDGTFVVYRVDQINAEIAEKISNIFDKDGGNSSGNTAWNAAGRVKRYGTNHGHILVFCLARV